MNKFSTIAVPWVLLLFSAFFPFDPAQCLADYSWRQGVAKHEEQPSPETSQLQMAFPGEFDLEACQQDCRSKFGVDPYFFGGGSGMDTSVWHLFTICIQDCNSAFWKDYDRRMKKLGEPEKGE